MSFSGSARVNGEVLPVLSSSTSPAFGLKVISRIGTRAEDLMMNCLTCSQTREARSG